MKIGETIYLDYQATTPPDKRVVAAMAQYFGEAFGNPHASDNLIGWQAAQAVDDAATRVGKLLGADTDEIVFTSGATEANNLALLGLGRRASRGMRRRILVSAIEHKSVLEVCRVLREQHGYRVESVPVDAAGIVDIVALKNALASDVLAVSINAVNNEIGTVQDIPALSKVIKATGALFHCDAAQAPCAIDLRNVCDFVDLLSLSSHKMYGPQGIGALYIRRELQDEIEPLIYGGGQQRNLRSGTVPLALCVGMGIAATLLVEAEEERVLLRRRRDRFVRHLTELPWPVVLNGPDSRQRHPGNANVRFDGFDAHELLSALQPRIAASMGSACTSGIAQPSHVLRAIGLTGEEAEASIRFSFGRNTTDAELDEAVNLVEKALAALATGIARRLA